MELHTAKMVEFSVDPLTKPKVAMSIFCHAESKSNNQNIKIKRQLFKKVTFLVNPLLILRILSFYPSLDTENTKKSYVLF